MLIIEAGIPYNYLVVIAVPIFTQPKENQIMNDPPLGDAPYDCDVCGTAILQGAELFCEECKAPLCSEECEREHTCAALDDEG